MENIIVLGGGMVGLSIAKDLKENGQNVSVADIDIEIESRLGKYDISFVEIDFSDHNAISTLVKKYDLVIGAVPGFMGFDILRIIIESGVNVVDISFMSEDSRDLDALARKNGVTAITDAGVAPGLSNLLFGKALFEFNTLNSATCYVGGLPQDPNPPWWYKSVFSPIDVIEEYTRPARFVKNGKIITKPAMTDIEQVEFEGIGFLDAFNSDGLRSLLDMPIPNMIEKTLRFRGHIQKIIAMKEEGLFKDSMINQTAKNLFIDWAPGKNDYDQTIMRVEFKGDKNGRNLIETLDFIDYYDREKNISSMARTTGYTCAAVASLILSNMFSSKGVFTMESLGNNSSLTSAILSYLLDRDIQYTINSKEI